MITDKQAPDQEGQKESFGTQIWELSNEHIPDFFRSQLHHSKISDKFIGLNCGYAEKELPLELLWPYDPDEHHGKAKAETKKAARKYSTLWAGCLVFQGLEFNKDGNFQDSNYITLKPIAPRTVINDGGKEKTIKYENPPKTPTQPFIPKGLDWGKFLLDKTIPLYITEGQKKALCLASNGFFGVSIPGIWNFNSKLESGEKVLHPSLAKLAEGREVRIVFDRDTKPKTVSAVNGATATLARQLLKNKSTKVTACKWDNYYGKGIDDVFYQYPEVAETALNNPLDFCESVFLSNKQFTSDEIINQRYLPSTEELILPTGVNLVAVKSQWGTGKTFSQKQRIESVKSRMSGKECQYSGWGTLYIVHRVALAHQAANTLGISVKENFSIDDYGAAICIDSLRPSSALKFDPNDYCGWDIIFDEFSQVKSHLLDSPTMSHSERLEVLENFRQLIINVINGGGTIWVYDAELSDTDIDFLKDLVGEGLKIYKVENIFTPEEKTPLYLLNSGNKILALADELILTKGQSVLIHCSGQKPNSKLGTINLENRYAQRLDNATTLILRVDKDTVADPNHQAYQFKKNPNTFLSLAKEKYERIIIICSPVLETGISIEIDVFDSVIGIASGVQSPESFCQSLNRYRLPAPRYAFINNRGLNSRYENSMSAKEIKKQLSRKTSAALTIIPNKNSLSEVVNGVPLSYYCKLVALANIQANNYKEWCRLILGGKYDIIENESKILENNEMIIELAEVAKQVSTEQIKIKEESIVAEAKKVAEANDISPSENEALQRMFTRTENERLSEKKYRMKSQWGARTDEEVESCLKADLNNVYAPIVNEFLSNLSIEELKARDEEDSRRYFEKGVPFFYSPDLAKTVKLPVILFLQFLGFPDIMPKLLNATPGELEVLAENLLEKYNANLKIMHLEGFKLPNQRRINFLRSVFKLYGGYRVLAVGKSNGKRLFKVVDDYSEARAVLLEKLRAKSALDKQEQENVSSTHAVEAISPIR